MTIPCIGCDPGASGGIAIICNGQQEVWKMPDTERDLHELLLSLRQWQGLQAHAAIEIVHSMPKQGVASSFTFGRNYGALRMALIASGIPFREVTPQKWQKELACLTKGDKNTSKRRAQELFPSVRVTHAVADALLIAEWLRRQP